ncbi:ester cyclase [Stenotrophomonas sp. RS-48]|uniref:ester cyclase n=1 Tax=Stenotrophomonas sp. RS-48 TaxID=3043300 RepID=UPI0024B5AC58|nr:ester cyclase [Stenotrophomonas sp. RS-48]MDI9248315.1 ester cyclase [Stenotrophomonas sp. RS-48]
MSKNKLEENKAIVERWFKAFWGSPADLSVIEELLAPNGLVHYPMHGPIRGHQAVRKMMTEFREAFPDLNFWGTSPLIAEGDYVVGRWDGGGTHTGPAFSDLPVGSLPEASGKKIRFTGTSVFRIENGKIVEEIGEEGALVALQQLDLLEKPNESYLEKYKDEAAA